MSKRYLYLLAVIFGMNNFISSQTAMTTPKPAPVYSGLSAAGDQKRDNGDFAGAIVAYTNEITKIDADAKRMVKLKADFASMSEFDKMNQNLDEINKSYLDWAKLYYGRAMCNISLMKKADAKPDLDICIGLDQTIADAYYQRALIIIDKTNRDPACMDMSMAASLGSEKAKVAFDDNFCWNSANQHFKEGCSKVTLRKYDDAVVELDVAIQLCPDSGSFYSKRGQAYLGLGNKTKAVEDFTKATEKSPSSPDGYYQLGLYYFNNDDFDKAFDFFTQALAKDAMNYDAYVYRAQCCERQNKMTSAIYDYGQAISIRPQDPEAYYRRALIERDMKETGKACKDFSRAASLGNEDAKNFLGECDK